SIPPAARNRTPRDSIEQFPLLGHPDLRLILYRTGEQPVAVAHPPYALRELLLVRRPQERRLFIPLPVLRRELRRVLVEEREKHLLRGRHQKQRASAEGHRSGVTSCFGEPVELKLRIRKPRHHRAWQHTHGDTRFAQLPHRSQTLLRRRRARLE